MEPKKNPDKKPYSRPEVQTSVAFERQILQSQVCEYSDSAGPPFCHKNNN